MNKMVGVDGSWPGGVVKVSQSHENEKRDPGTTKYVLCCPTLLRIWGSYMVGMPQLNLHVRIFHFTGIVNNLWMWLLLCFFVLLST